MQTSNFKLHIEWSTDISRSFRAISTLVVWELVPNNCTVACPVRHVPNATVNFQLYPAMRSLSPLALTAAIFRFCDWFPLLHGMIGSQSSRRIKIQSRLSRSNFLSLAPKGARWVGWAWLCWLYSLLLRTWGKRLRFVWSQRLYSSREVTLATSFEHDVGSPRFQVVLCRPLR